MNKLREYFSETYNELFNKVSWPTWSELQSSALIVMVASVLISIVIFMMDGTFSWLLEKYYQLS